MSDGVLGLLTGFAAAFAVGSLGAAFASLHRRSRDREAAIHARLAERAARKYIVEVEYSDGRRETLTERPAPKNAKRRAAVEHAVRELESA